MPSPASNSTILMLTSLGSYGNPIALNYFPGLDIDARIQPIVRIDIELANFFTG